LRDCTAASLRLAISAYPPTYVFILVSVRRLEQTTPEGPKSVHTQTVCSQPAAAIVYLTQNTPVRRLYLQTSLYLLFRSFNERCRYPVLVFHEGDFTEDSIAAIRESIAGELRSLIWFRQVDTGDFRAPASVTADIVEANRIIVPDARGLNYRSMCRWWIRHAARYLAPYEFYMRLDDDSFIEEILDYDPFRVVRAAGVDYASNLVHVEHPLNALGLLEMSKDLLGDTDPLRSLFLHGDVTETVEPSSLTAFLARIPGELRQRIDTTALSGPVIYYNNFHIARASLWSHPTIARYFEAIDQSNGIYHLRWGDAALHTIALTAAEGLTLGRFSFRYSKRYEREQGTYVNTNHPIARHYFDTNAPVLSDKRTGSMTDFDAFNDLLAARGLSDLTRIIA
jgi:hypothetical protein